MQEKSERCARHAARERGLALKAGCDRLKDDDRACAVVETPEYDRIDDVERARDPRAAGRS
jgi:hypothetical protein